ncbi:hypothetical protein PGB90_007724 [Kerria lacca]
MYNMFGVKYRILVSSGELSAIFISYLILLLYLSRVIGAVKISSVSVPSRINSSSTEPVKLDCVFEFDSSEKNLADHELVIQWKLNKSMLLYQWISNKPPFINNTVKNRIDSTYKILPGTKPTNMPLTFTTRSIDLTGHYTCKVATFRGEDSEERLMQAFVPMDEINFYYILDSDTNTLNIICRAERIYPRPSLHLFINEKSLMILEINTLEKENHLYDINATYTVPLDNLTSKTTFNCTINLPQVNYSDSKILYYSKAGSENYSNNSSSLLTRSNPSGIGPQNTYNFNLLLLTTIIAIYQITKTTNYKKVL